MVKCGVCADRGSTCKGCVDGDKYRVIPASAVTPWHKPRTVEGAEHDIPNTAVKRH